MNQIKEKQAKIQKQLRDKVMAVLTPEQRKAAEEKMKQVRGPRAKQGEGQQKRRAEGKARKSVQE